MIGDSAVVEAWLAAVNDQDARQLEALTNEQVEIIGPRGQGVADRRVLGAWLARSGFQAAARRWFCGGDGRVVVEQLAQWHDVATGAQQDQRVIGSEFTVHASRVARYVRHDAGVSDALAAAGLDEQRDLVTSRE
jgi:hypothetical protein